MYIIWFIWQYKRVITLFAKAAETSEKIDPVDFHTMNEEEDIEVQTDDANFKINIEDLSPDATNKEN